MRALERLIAILEAVADDSVAATTTAISTRVGLSLSTTSRLVKELEQEGLIERTYDNGPFTLGGRFLALARSAIQPASLLNAALPVMEELRDLTQETVSLHIRQRDVRVCIAQVESRRQVRRVVPVGYEVGINVGATGEVLLAGFPAPDLEAYVDSLGLSPGGSRRPRNAARPDPPGRMVADRRSGGARPLRCGRRGGGRRSDDRGAEHLGAQLTVDGLGHARICPQHPGRHPPDLAAAGGRLESLRAPGRR